MSPKLPKGPQLSLEDPQTNAERVVALMLTRDGFSRWLGITVSNIGPSRATCTLTVRHEMLNGFGVCHGGVTFALADSAFAFASNTQGNVAMSIDNQISYPAPAREGDVLTAVAREESGTDRLAFYRVEVTNQAGTLVAIFKGTVYKTRTPHLPETDT
ncbi:MAG: hydroxyphenylacetyl-CoA thioesterase PaaI [Gemmatimonadetes bacterium]|nr:hydroxyphenylacetyl-CoA thioesterase PaaI [Gemmatimonadota bacterium]